MAKKKTKIVLPSDAEVGEYGARPGAAAGRDAPAEASQARAEAGGAGLPAAEAGGAKAPTAEARSEADEWREKCLRARAELANYQRRMEKDRAETLRYANATLVRALLPILDDLERVIASGSEAGGDMETVVNGVKLTLENFLKVLGDFQVSRIEAEGQPFDPAVHEAMMEQPGEGPSEPTVLQEMVKGYRLHDRVLRAARVIVSKPPGEAAGKEDDTGEAAEPAARTDGD